MKRIRKLGLVALAALALSASVGAGSSSASGFVPSGAGFPEYPATISGQATSGAFFEMGFRSFGCGNFPEQLISKAINSPIDTLYHSGKNTSCSNETFGKATLEHNGCGTIFHSGPEVSPGVFSATVDIGPNAGVSKCGPIRINSSTCDVLIPEQKGLTGATLVNHGNGALPDSVEASMKSIVKVSLEGCGPNEVKFATFYGSWEPKAYNVAGEPIDLRVNQTGVYTGKEGFEAEGYPVTFFGEQDAGNLHQLAFGVRTVKCADISFDGEAAGPSNELALEASYTGCTSTLWGETLSATFAMNNCHYVFDVAGTVDVACTEGDAIEVKVYNNAKEPVGSLICSYEIVPQQEIGSVSYSTIGEGNGRKIDVDLALKGLNRTRTYGTLAACGPISSTGTYTGSLIVDGVR